MASSEQSSVVSSIQELVKVENERVLAENAEREAVRVRARAQRAQEQQHERELAEQRAAREREAVHLEFLAHESAQATERLTAQAEAELQRARQELEHQYQMKSLHFSERLSTLSGRQRVLVAALVTMTAGTILGWLLLVVPSERRAQADYAVLKGLYEKSTQERGFLEESYSRERRQLLERVNDLLKRSIIPPNRAPTEPPSARAPSRAPMVVKPNPKPHCVCQAGDPLCDCPAH